MTRVLHCTYSPALLLVLSALVALISVLAVWRFHRSGRGSMIAFAFGVGLAGAAILALLNAEHLPLLGWASPGFCFGSLGAAHLASFVLPPFASLGTAAIARRRSMTRTAAGLAMAATRSPRRVGRGSVTIQSSAPRSIEGSPTESGGTDARAGKR